MNFVQFFMIYVFSCVVLLIVIKWDKKEESEKRRMRNQRKIWIDDEDE